MRKLALCALMLCLLCAPACAPANEPLADGQYTVEVTLSGGSGRAGVESPTKVTVRNGAVTATVVWSSPYYEYMLVDGETYYPVGEEGNSAFEVPVSFDADIPILAQTIAMSEPHVIEYTLCFDSATLQPLRPGALVWLAPVLALGVGGAGYLVLRRGKRAGKGKRT